MKLIELYNSMAEYNRSVAYGSECAAFGDFSYDSYKELGVGPRSDEAYDIDVPEDFAEFWLAVANGESAAYDADGSRTPL